MTQKWRAVGPLVVDVETGVEIAECTTHFSDRLPKRPLTDAEAFLAMGKIPLQKHITDDFILAVVRATEAAHGIRGEK